MTGSELVTMWVEKLEEKLPAAEVQEEFSGHMLRKPEKPVVSVGILQEECAEGVCEVKLGIRLYTMEAGAAAELMTAIFGTVSALPCSLRSIVRGETKYDSTLGCLVTPCTVLAVMGTAVENAVKMRFGSFVFPNDPTSIQVTHRGMIRESVMADGSAKAERVGAYRRRVTGKGCFTGADAMENYRALEAMFGESCTLFLPGRIPFEATLSELTLSGIRERDTVSYSFTFIETGDVPTGLSGRTYLAKEGENLWDYAYFAGVSIDAMAEANPQIGCIAALQAGEVVHIP